MIERFAVPDELTCYYDRPAEPANVHVEVRVPGRLEEAILRASVGAVLDAEPRLRTRRRAAGAWRRSYHWEFPVAPDLDPVHVVAHGSEGDLERHRSGFLSRPLSLDRSPPFALLLAHGPRGDALVLNAHHAAFDGLSCLRLLRRIAAEYSELAGPGDAEAGLAGARSVPGPVAAGLVPGPVIRPAGEGQAPGLAAVGPSEPWRTAATRRLPDARARSGAITRIAPSQGRARQRKEPGYGTCLLAWDGLAELGWLRSADYSVNDLLIAALMITVSEWNESCGGRSGRIRITMPIGERAEVAGDGQWANRSRLTAVTARVCAAVPRAELLCEVARQTRLAKQRPGPQVDPVSRGLVAAPVPVVLKDKVLRAALRIAGPVVCDTSLVTNLGVTSAPSFGAVTATEVWFSTSAHMPRGLSVGAVTVGGRLLLTFRYRLALLTEADATDFARRYGQVLDQFARREAVAA